MHKKLSLIIACRNEINNLPDLLASIENQTIKPDEVIFIDDNSTDETFSFLQKYSQNHPLIKVIKNNSKGKKSALLQASEITESEYILFTDADCKLHTNHCLIASNFIAKHNPDMILGAVKIEDDKNIFNIIEQIEFASLQAVTAYSALIDKPIMCNGANLIVKREKYLQYFSKINTNIASGDDMFMLHAFKKNRLNIKYIYDTNYIVETKGTNSLSKFIKQRTRWAAKTINYTDITTILIAILVAMINILLIATLIITPYYLIPTFFIIFLIENIILLPFLIKYKQKRVLKYYPFLFPIISILYPFYIITILISIIFYNKRFPQWK